MAHRRYFAGSLLAIALTAAFLHQGVEHLAAQAQTPDYCHVPASEAAQKETLRQAALRGDSTAQQNYQTIVAQHAQRLQQCRSQSWLQTQAIWIRLHPCDSKPGALDALLDWAVNRGYNQVNVEVFSNGQVLLPSSDNPTTWAAVVQSPGAERVDLLAQSIQRGHQRGLKIYAWLFSLNFGYAYANRPDRQQVLARNGWGDTTLTVGTKTSQNTNVDLTTLDEVFVDPYNAQARSDYAQLIQAVIQRRPDGVLFDYIRYPKGAGAASIVSNVKDLWIYGDAAQQALYQRAQNRKGEELIRRFVTQGRISAQDLATVDRLYPSEKEPMWQGRTPSVPWTAAAAKRQPYLQDELWKLTVAHAMQGPIDYLAAVSAPVQQQGIPVGAVFFPDANQSVRQGFDSRLQRWDQFPAAIEWHPMAYGVCGDPSCIVSQVQRVLNQAPASTFIEPVLAGTWQQSVNNRPALEVQMQAIRQAAPQIRAISHFSYSWQEPQLDRERKFCRL